MKLLYKWLNRRSQRRGLNWPRFKRLLERFQVPGPRIRPYTKEHPILSARLPRLLREASTIEEPGAGNLHAGICAGAAG